VLEIQVHTSVCIILRCPYLPRLCSAKKKCKAKHLIIKHSILHLFYFLKLFFMLLLDEISWCKFSFIAVFCCKRGTSCYYVKLFIIV